MEYSFKKLRHLYEVHEEFTAGVMLDGWEVKALDANAGDINTGYCVIKGSNFCLINAKISPLFHQAVDNDQEKRDRILLLNKSEKEKIRKKLEVKGYTCVPTRLYRDKNRLWKLDIALVTGLKDHDRREKIKERDLKRMEEQ